MLEWFETNETFVAKGISFKTQALYVAVFCTRYLDLLTFEFVSVYNVVMKLFFIASSVYILYLMRIRFRCVSERPPPPGPVSSRTMEANARPVD